MAESGRKRAARVRAVLRTLHRDAGYFVVGLTFLYALSGLAVNHIADWDPNFEQFERTHHVALPASADDEAIVRTVLASLGEASLPTDSYRVDPKRLDIVFGDRRTLHVDPTSGHVVEEGQKPRFLLRAANWLHLNRGKKAWTLVADAYAVLLLFLASSGLFMLPGRKGLFGRAGVIALAGAAVPFLYVVLSGGP